MNNEEITQLLKFMIGTRYVPAAKAYVSELTGRPRVYGPRDITTKEYDTNRIGIRADAGELIVGFNFG